MAEWHAMTLELRAVVVAGGEAGARAWKVGGLAGGSSSGRDGDDGRFGGG